MDPRRILVVAVLALLATAARAIADPCPGGCDGCSLRQQAGTRVLAGVALDGRVYSDAAYVALVQRQFDYANLEGFDWGTQHPSADPADYHFEERDQFVDWARAHGFATLGHHVVWAPNEHLPDYINGMTQSQLTAELQSYVSTMVGHFRGRMRAWSALNEAINDTDFTLRDNVLKQKLGADYVDLVFNAAHAADPNALLFYNEYGAEGLGSKSDAVFNHVKTWRERGVPIHGVGLQMHLEAWDHPDAGAIQSNIERLVSLGVLVEISEMDVRVDQLAGSLAHKLEVQRQIYHDVVAACLAVPGCTAVNIFGVDDPSSWICGFKHVCDGYPLMYDGLFRRKPSYYGVLEALRGVSFGCFTSESGDYSCP